MAGTFVKNHLWPILGGLASAILTGITSATSSGSLDWKSLVAAVIAAALGYGLTVLNRYGGGKEAWLQPPRDPKAPPAIPADKEK